MSALVVSAALQRSVADHCEQWDPRETGGILLGFRCTTAVHVVGFGGPGPHARHAHASFTRDGRFAQQLLERNVEDSAGAVDYLGEWHSHPAAVGPSGRDAASIAWIAENALYDCSVPYLVVVIRERPSWVFHAFAATDGRLVRVDIREDCADAALHPAINILVTPS
jgi:integrative and conjugative element protein (TIGR02256 family)